MRTLNIFMAGLAASLAIFAACSKQEKPAEIPNVPQAPAENTDNGFQTLKATASDTKTTADGVHVLWTSGDVIGVFCGQVSSTTSATFTTSTSTPSASAEFTKSDENTPTKLDDYYYAAYPQAGINQWYYSENGGGVYRLYFSFKKEQTAVKGGWDPAHGAMAAKSTDNTFSFKHYSAYIKFTVGPSSSAFKSITVTSIDGTNIVDRLRIDIPAMTYSPNNLAALRSPYVKLSTSDGNAFEQGTYYICIIPRQYAQGFTLTFENAAGQTTTKTVSGDFTFEAGDVANIGTVGTLSFVSPIKVGIAYEESNVNQGVIFWADQDSRKAKIISGAVKNVKWAASNPLSTEVNEYLTSHTPAENHEYVKQLADYDETNYPAVYFCDQLGAGWRLPSRDELNDLLKLYWGVSSLTANTNYFTANNEASISAFDTELAKCITDDPATTYDETKISCGTPSGTVNYWTGHANPASLPNTRIFRVNIAPKYIFESYANPTNVQYVRCVREVQIP